MVKVEDALLHLGYDQTDPAVVANVTRALRDAESYLQGAVGDDVLDLLPDDPKAERLVLTYLEDLYDERGLTSAKAGNAKREMVHSLELQLRMKLARMREEAAAE